MKIGFKTVLFTAMLACLGTWLWTVAESWSLDNEFAQSVTDPVFMRTDHGTFDLTSPPTALTRCPKEYKRLKSILDREGRLLHLVKFGDVVSHSDLGDIRDLGGKIVGYMPDNVVIVSGSPEMALPLSGLNRVLTVRERPPWLSLDPYLMKWLDKRSSKSVARLSVSGRDFEDVTAILDDYGIHYEKGDGSPVIIGRVDELKKRIIPMLLMHPAIAFVGRQVFARLM